MYRCKMVIVGMRYRSGALAKLPGGVKRQINRGLPYFWIDIEMVRMIRSLKLVRKERSYDAAWKRGVEDEALGVPTVTNSFF